VDIMSEQIPTHRVIQFTQGIDRLVQQRGSRFRGAVRIKSGVKGKQAMFDQIGATTAVEATTRHRDTPLIDTPHARRMAVMRSWEVADLVDPEDVARVLNDPTTEYSANMADAMGRQMDDLLITAATGTAQTGETGSTNVVLPATQKVVAGGTGLTVAKLKSASKILKREENNPDEPWWIAVNAEAEEDLLSDATDAAQITSRDYVADQPLVTGRIRRFMGFNFIMSNRLTLDANGDRQIIAWRQSALGLAIGKDSSGRMSERPDKSYAMQVFYSMTIGTTRLEEAGVVEIAAVGA
jgi:hypothetical protein